MFVLFLSKAGVTSGILTCFGVFAFRFYKFWGFGVLNFCSFGWFCSFECVSLVVLDLWSLGLWDFFGFWSFACGVWSFLHC